MPVLEPIADGVWTSTVEVPLLRVMRIPAAMTVLRLRGDELLLHSPVPLTPERKAEVDALGRVTHLYSPNSFHHLSLGFWSAAYPHAKVHGSHALTKKRRDLRIDRFQDAPEPAFESVLDEVRIEGFLLEESVLLHRASKTLVVADLVHHFTPTHRLTRWYASLAGFNGGVAISKVIRSTSFPDKKAARRSVDAVLALDFERIIVGHGTVITQNPKEQLARAYDWLR